MFCSVFPSHSDSFPHDTLQVGFPYPKTPKCPSLNPKPQTPNPKSPYGIQYMSAPSSFTRWHRATSGSPSFASAVHASSEPCSSNLRPVLYPESQRALDGPTHIYVNVTVYVYDYVHVCMCVCASIFNTSLLLLLVVLLQLLLLLLLLLFLYTSNFALFCMYVSVYVPFVMQCV